MLRVESRPRGKITGGIGHDGDGGGGWRGEGGAGGDAFPVPVAKVGLWLFLAMATLLFAAIFSAYVVRMGSSDWQSFPKPGLLWVNTGILLLSSLAFQGAWTAARRGHSPGLHLRLLVAGGLGILFVLGQLLAWQRIAASGFFLATNPSSSFFYLITALHGLHLLGGLVAWGRTAVRAWQGAYTSQNHLGVELCAIYWHFLLLVWLVMFGLIWLT